MHLTHRTILITGGSSGIGLELAIQLHKRGNKVIITGRSAEKLATAKERENGLVTMVSDVTKLDDIQRLYSFIKESHPTLSVLINNAGIMNKVNLYTAQGNVENIAEEVNVNLIALIQMTVIFLPLLKEQKEAAIVNVSSGLAFVPYPICPIYGASKSGVHSFTRALRVQLQTAKSTVQVFELAPGPTKTNLISEWKDDSTDESSFMDADKVATFAIKGIEGGSSLMLPGLAKVLKLMGWLAPDFMMRMLSKDVDKMLAEGKEGKQ